MANPGVYRRLRDKFFPEGLPPAGSFEGQTVLVTGGTTGLGLAAAQHFAALGAHVIITCRSKERGESVRHKIEQRGKGNITIMELDMGYYSSCVSFVDELKKTQSAHGGLDCVILNAGSARYSFVEGPEGWEETIQVNTLSTTLLGLLLLSWMKNKQKSRKSPAHLVFVTSRDHLDPDISKWAEWATRDGLLQHFSMKENWPAGEMNPNYANSKLLVMYAVNELCRLAMGPDGKPCIIINTLCPGLVQTNITRDVSNQPLLTKITVSLYFKILAKSPNYGARSYVNAVLKPQEEHGKFLIGAFTEEEYRNDTGMEMQTIAWNEIIRELGSKVPDLNKVIDDLGQ
ncbi:hypothetical protein G7Y89_g5222 [Cudoniella acicularis]|uniref:Uncharacterized protein n=1 Tax=Cudoniella acicularis TaxID=354080 RepID=A0A8H4RR19_9HELO|nr:hypothetical protein G7Y89_g5222 [Cudoniella acicularis]